MLFLMILLACGLYGGLHSWLASPGVKQRVSTRLGSRGGRYYRLFYNIVGSITALPLFALARWLPDQPLYTIPFPWTLLTYGLQALGVVGLVIEVRQTGMVEFLGLDGLLPGWQPRSAQLVTGVLYRWVRHPLYTCGLLVLWLILGMTWNRLALALGLTFYILAGIPFEERKLAREFGAEYENYRQKTPMLIPWMK